MYSARPLSPQGEAARLQQRVRVPPVLRDLPAAAAGLGHLQRPVQPRAVAPPLPHATHSLRCHGAYDVHYREEEEEDEEEATVGE